MINVQIKAYYPFSSSWGNDLMNLSRRKNKKYLMAMVSWTIPLVYIVKKNANDDDFTNHPTSLCRGKNANSNGLIDPSDTANS